MEDSLDQKIEFCTPVVEYIAENVQGKVFIDVGAHVGGFCIPLLLNSGFEKCYAFEANPESAKRLKKNAKEYGCDIEVFNKAILHGQGTADLRVPVDAESGLATVGNPKRYKEWIDVEVEVDRLDTCGIESVDFIKIDTEGSELLVISGARELLRREQPPILFELIGVNTAQCGYAPEAVLHELSRLGYNWIKAVSQRDFLARTSGF